MRSIRYLIPTFLIFLVNGVLLLTFSSFVSWLAFLIALLLTVYFMIYAVRIKQKRGRKKWEGAHIPSLFSLSILLLPLIFGLAIAYEGFVGWRSATLAIGASGLTITFWSCFVTVPLAVRSKVAENREYEVPLKSYPKVSILVPAYNEENCIAATLEALIEASYPNKEIIVVDDGSTDKTAKIAMQYNSEGVKVFSKENGGKSSALNYGFALSDGDPIIIVDADSIIERRAIKELVKKFENPDVVAVCGNIKVRNRNNFLTKCQALEYIFSINIAKRALDTFGAISVVPGALGAFRRGTLTEGGLYDKDTLTEDFDTTLKVLKTGKVVEASSFASAYTEAPATIRDLYKQRMRWYRGNYQTIFKHRDAFTNPRFGPLHQLSYPFLLLNMLILPFIGIVIWASTIMAIIEGWWLQVTYLFLIFLCLQFLVSTLAVLIDDEDKSLILYAPFFVVGFKHLIDFWMIKALIDVLIRKNLRWTSAKRATHL
jgi:poly-beta-1,6 N-acetyl-D-glucosamine synthase